MAVVYAFIGLILSVYAAKIVAQRVLPTHSSSAFQRKAGHTMLVRALVVAILVAMALAMDAFAR